MLSLQGRGAAQISCHFSWVTAMISRISGCCSTWKGFIGNRCQLSQSARGWAACTYHLQQLAQPLASPFTAPRSQNARDPEREREWDNRGRMDRSAIILIISHCGTLLRDPIHWPWPRIISGQMIILSSRAADIYFKRWTFSGGPEAQVHQMNWGQWKSKSAWWRPGALLLCCAVWGADV